MISKLFYLFLAGGLGGLLGWMVQEPFFPRDPYTHPHMFYGAVMGMCISGMLGAARGWQRGSLHHVMWGLAIAGGVGFLGGLFADSVGSVVFGMLGGKTGEAHSFFEFIYQLFARGFAFLFYGAFIGVSEGIATRSVRRLIQGVIGGAIGGFAGGFLFNLVARLTLPLQAAFDPTKFGVGGGRGAEIGIFSRAIAFTIMGALIGLFIGLIEMVAKQAWLRVVLGRNEGKEYLIDAATTSIGRAESADVPLFGDANVAPVHARIHKQGNVYAIVDGGAPIGTVVNGQRIQQARIGDGDQLQIGGHQLTFHERAGAAQRASRDARRAAPPPIAVPPGMCPYCGQKKDAYGRCACSVHPGDPAQPIPTAQPSPTPTTTGPTLVAIDGPLAGLRVAVGAAGATMGREPSNTVAMAFDSTTSRRHARVALESNGVVVYDEGSTNGTFVNNARITRQELRPGDVVRVGATSFRLEA